MPLEGHVNNGHYVLQIRVEYISWYCFLKKKKHHRFNKYNVNADGICFTNAQELIRMLRTQPTKGVLVLVFYLTALTIYIRIITVVQYFKLTL